MTCVFTGRQFMAFLSDPDFWGNGQSYENLRLLVNGVPCGEGEFEKDWDPQDLAMEDFVQVLGGTWHGHGFKLPSHQMADVIEHWLAGHKPQKVVPAKPKTLPKLKEPPALTPRFKVPEPVKTEDAPRAAVARPTFKI